MERISSTRFREACLSLRFLWKFSEAWRVDIIYWISPVLNRSGNYGHKFVMLLGWSTTDTAPVFTKLTPWWVFLKHYYTESHENSTFSVHGRTELPYKAFFFFFFRRSPKMIRCVRTKVYTCLFCLYVYFVLSVGSWMAGDRCNLDDAFGGTLFLYYWFFRIFFSVNIL
jgi:hypothetical protein